MAKPLIETVKDTIQFAMQAGPENAGSVLMFAAAIGTKGMSDADAAAALQEARRQLFKPSENTAGRVA